MKFKLRNKVTGKVIEYERKDTESRETERMNGRIRSKAVEKKVVTKKSRKA